MVLDDTALSLFEDDPVDGEVINILGVDDDQYDDSSENKRDPSYCFRFTWLGPKFDRDSKIANITCKTAIKGAKGVPCVQPLVATSESKCRSTPPLSHKISLFNSVGQLIKIYRRFYVTFSSFLLHSTLDNSNLPDTEWMWETYYRKPDHIACRLVKGEVCAKYSYFFNGAGKLF